MNGRSIVLVGHPTTTIGMGEHLRSVHRAFSAAMVPTSVIDIYGPQADAEPTYVADYRGCINHRPSDGINIFCINGDEIPSALKTLKARGVEFETGHNVIYPAWELARYPREWSDGFKDFDEVWTPSKFVQESILGSTELPVFHMPLACEVRTRTLATRRSFGIPESSFVFFFFFDFLSYLERKNPLGVLRAFEMATSALSGEKVCLILKTNSSSVRPDLAQRVANMLERASGHVVLIDRVLLEAEVNTLMDLCDCFVSLHRSEGFGRGMSEAMFLGKPVIATAYSGNMDFCDPATTKLVKYSLIPVRVGEYPHWQEQVWADPDLRDAASAMIDLVKNQKAGRAMGQRARVRIRRDHSYRAVGLRYAARCNEIFES